MRAALHAAAAGQVLCRVHGSSDVQERDDCWQPGGATVALLASTIPQPLTAVKAESFGLWLAQHACLLHTLDMTCKPGKPEAPLIAAAAAKGLTEAAAAAEGVAGRRGLLLQGYRGCWTDSILQQLPAASLTYLSLTDDLGRSTEMGQEFFKREDFGPLCRSAQASLKRFINLRHLGCLEDDYTNCNNVSGILPALRGMTKLTYLDIGLDRGLEHYMHCLPASLCVLRMAADNEGYRLDLMDEENGTHDEYEARWPSPMDISHLTALTALDLTRDVACVVQTGDVLPPNLQQLKVRDVRCWDPVLELTCLRSIRAQEVPMAVVRSMAVKLTHLQDVCISDAQGCSAADFWAYAKLPMRKLGGLRLSASNLPQLSLLTGLTCLKANFDDPDLAQVDQWQQLGRLLKSMKHLVKLQVGKDPLIQEHMLPGWLATEAAVLPLAITLGGLPALRSVFLQPLRFSAEACMALAAASALTRLQLQSAGLHDFGVISMVMGMPDLQVLCMQNSPDVTML